MKIYLTDEGLQPSLVESLPPWLDPEGDDDIEPLCLWSMFLGWVANWLMIVSFLVALAIFGTGLVRALLSGHLVDFEPAVWKLMLFLIVFGLQPSTLMWLGYAVHARRWGYGAILCSLTAMVSMAGAWILYAIIG